jgi:hypothetical protein
VDLSQPARTPGVMIAMFDIPDSLDGEFNAWYDDEHVPDKVGAIPGFIRARRYKSLDGRPNYLCIYELEDVGVVDSPRYQSQYQNGTPTTIRMKASARTFCRNVYAQIADVHGIALDQQVLPPGPAAETTRQ